jgi:hypothetical protein
MPADLEPPTAGVAHDFPAGVPLDSLTPTMRRMVGTAAAERHREHIIIPLFSNAGMTAMLINLLCSMRRVAVRNWMAIAMDNRTCDRLPGTFRADGPHACVHPYVEKPLVSAGKLKYASSDFWRLVIQRPLWVRWLLTVGYTVLQCDVDVVWLRDPFPVFNTGVYASQHLVSQSEQTFGSNCGFYLARANTTTVRFMDTWLEDMVGLNATWRKKARALRHSSPGRTRLARWHRSIDAQFHACAGACTGRAAP